MTDSAHTDELTEVLHLLAPGSTVRDGLERILGAGRGALIVLGWTPEVEALVTGGFAIETNTTPQRIAELAKMDGALVVDETAERILRANVHLVPDPTIPTSETGTRHRSAERTSRQTGVPVVSVSESMSLVTLYVGERRRRLEPISQVLFRANQALATLERYRVRLEQVSGTLFQRELEGTVALRDVATTLQRTEMVRRIAREVADHVAELGKEGRLIELQRDELVSDVDTGRVLTVRDYLSDRRRRLETVLGTLDSLTPEGLLDLDEIAAALAYDPSTPAEQHVTPRGYRVLARIPRLPSSVIDNMVARFGTLPRILEADLESLTEVDGIGETRAKSIRDGLDRLRESTVHDHTPRRQRAPTTPSARV